MVALSGVFLADFLAHLGTERAARFGAVAGVAESLAALLQAGRTAWPQIDVPPEEFVRRVADGLPDGRDPLEALNATHAADLYLICGCTRGDATALAEFEKAFMVRAVDMVRTRVAPDLADEALQRLRVKLLTAEDGQKPRIAGYDGRGPLGAWLFVAAARIAIDLRRSERDQTQLGDVLQEIAGETDTEIGYLKLRYGKELELALSEALAKLSEHETTILRLTFQENMSGDALAEIYKVSRRTIVRRLAEIRQRLMAETERALAARLKLSSAELESLVALVVSRISVNLRDLVPDEKE